MESQLQEEHGTEILTVEPLIIENGRDLENGDKQTNNQDLTTSTNDEQHWTASTPIDSSDNWRQQQQQHDNSATAGQGSWPGPQLQSKELQQHDNTATASQGSWPGPPNQHFEASARPIPADFQRFPRPLADSGLELQRPGAEQQRGPRTLADPGAELTLMRRLSSSEASWRNREQFQVDTSGYRSGVSGRERSRASESWTASTDREETWRSSFNRGQESTSWRPEYMRGVGGEEGWRQERGGENWRQGISGGESWRHNNSGSSGVLFSALPGHMQAAGGGSTAGNVTTASSSYHSVPGTTSTSYHSTSGNHQTTSSAHQGSQQIMHPNIPMIIQPNNNMGNMTHSMGNLPNINMGSLPGNMGNINNTWQNRFDERHNNDLLRLNDRYNDCGMREGGLSRESSRDDINSVCDQQFEYEERFRVDRQKLEMMMMGSADTAFGETAGAFFDKIAAETDTVVIWPSRLKIGAKSKKDPHVRVGGQKEGVLVAKARILEILDTKVNSRVTIKMDVSYTDHSHIIGKGGNTIRRVMSDTKCHIHFPDSNRSNPNEKSNQVSIAGDGVKGVERARARVRELTPLIFQFDLAIVPSFHAVPDPNNTYLRAIQDQYNVQVSFRQKQKNFHTTTVVIKGCELEASRVKEATLLLMDHLCPNNAAASAVNMTMEISPGHHAIVVGKGSINLRVIMQRTNTIIIFPDAADPNIPPIRKGSVTISGAIHNVYLARQLLLGSLPIVMMFDLPENIDTQESMIQKLQDENEVTITIKPKARQTNKSVIIKSQERNVGGMYVARHKLLEMEGEVVKAEIPETYKVPLVGSSSIFHLASLPANRGPFLCPNPQMQALGSPLSPNFIPPPCFTPVTPTFPPVSPWAFPAVPPLASDLGRMTASTGNPYQSLQDYMMYVGLQQQQQQQLQQQQHQEQLKKQRQQQHQQQQLEMEKKQRWTSPQQNISRLGPSGSDLGSSMHSSPVHSPRNSSPVNANGNLTNNLHKMELTGSSGIETNNHSSDLSAIMADFPELSCTDRRAPGCEKKVAEIVDYEQARIRANQAISQKPGGEERKPNPGWSGLGFSSSMPESVIREKMQGEARAHRGELSWISGLEQLKEGEEGGQDDLGRILHTVGLAKYSEVFQRHEVDLQTFASLTEDELKEIGINAFGPRKKLLMLAKQVANL